MRRRLPTAAVRLLAGDKEPVRVASTTNLQLSGLIAVDGVTVEVGDRTYLAENKPLQLSIAHKLGFTVPETRIMNHPPQELFEHKSEVAIKALDSFLLRVEGEDAFFYTQAVSLDQVPADTLQAMPVWAALVVGSPVAEGG